MSRTRRFDGERFGLEYAGSKKSTAVARAKALRKRGYKARVVRCREHGSDGSGRTVRIKRWEYRVYARMK